MAADKNTKPKDITGLQTVRVPGSNEMWANHEYYKSKGISDADNPYTIQPIKYLGNWYAGVAENPNSKYLKGQPTSGLLGTGKDEQWGLDRGYFGLDTPNNPEGLLTGYNLGQWHNALNQADYTGLQKLMPELAPVMEAYKPAAQKFIEMSAAQGMPTHLINSRTGQMAQTPDDVIEQWMRIVGVQRGSSDYGLKQRSVEELTPWLDVQGPGGQGFVPFLEHYAVEPQSWIEKNSPYLLGALSLMGLNPIGLLGKGIGSALGGSALANAAGGAAVSAAMGGNPLTSLFGLAAESAGLGATPNVEGGGGMASFDLSNIGNMLKGNNLLNTALTSYLSNPDSPLTGLASVLGGQIAPQLTQSLGLTGQTADIANNALQGWIQNRQYGLEGKSGALYGALSPALKDMLGLSGTAGNAVSGYLAGQQYGMDPQQAAIMQALGINVTPEMAAGMVKDNWLPMLFGLGNTGRMDEAAGMAGPGGTAQGGGAYQGTGTATGTAGGGGQAGGNVLQNLFGMLGGGAAGGGGGNLLSQALPLLLMSGAFNQGDSGGGGGGAATTQAPVPYGNSAVDVYNRLMDAQDYRLANAQKEAMGTLDDELMRSGMFQSSVAQDRRADALRQLMDSRAAASNANALNAAQYAEGSRQFDTGLAQNAYQYGTNRGDEQSRFNQQGRASLVSALFPYLMGAPSTQGSPVSGMLQNLFGLAGNTGTPQPQPQPAMQTPQPAPMPFQSNIGTYNQNMGYNNMDLASDMSKLTQLFGGSPLGQNGGRTAVNPVRPSSSLDMAAGFGQQPGTQYPGGPNWRDLNKNNFAFSM